MHMPIRSWKRTLSTLGLKLIEAKPKRRKRKTRTSRFEPLEPKQLLAADLVSQEENGTLSTAEVATVLPNAEFVIEAEIGDHADGNNDIDLFQVEMVEGQQLLIDVVTPFSSSLDSYVRVFDESGSPVPDPMNSGQYFENDDEGYGSTDSYVAFTAPSTGTFFVGVSSSGNSTYDATAGTGNGSGGMSSGAYSLKLTRLGDVGDTIATSQLIDLENGPVSITTEIGDSTDGHNDVDMFEIELIAGQEVVIDLETPYSNLDTYIRLFDNQGNPVQDPDNPSIYLENDDEGYGTTDSYLSFTAPSTGTFFIGVSSSGNSSYSANYAGSGWGGGSSGEYTIFVSATFTDISDTISGALELDLSGGMAQHTSEIGDNAYGHNDVDMFEIELIAGQEVVIDLETPNSSLDTYIRLFDNQGNPVQDPDNPSNYLENDDEGYGTTDSYLAFTAPASGTFFIGVSSSGNSSYSANYAGSAWGGGTSGEYTILVSALSPDISDTISGAFPLMLVDGEAQHTSEIGDNLYGHNDVDMFEIELIAGQEVVIDLETPNSNLDTYIRLFDNQGNPVQDPDNPSNYLENDDEGYGTTDSYLAFTAPATGTFFIGVSSSGNSSYSADYAGSGWGGGSSGEYTILVNISAPIEGPIVTVQDGSTTLTSGVSTVNFGSVSEHGSVSKTFQIHNPGTETLTLSDSSLQLPTGYSLIGSFPTSIGAGQSANFELRLSSTALGSYPGTVSFQTNDPNLAQFEFDVQGQVIAHVPEMAINSPSGPEGSILTFTVTLAEETSGSVTVDYYTSGYTATSGVDFEATSGTLTFLPGQASRTIDVTLYAGQLQAPSEQFFMILTNPSGATLVTATGTGTILEYFPDNEAPTVVAPLGDMIVDEDDLIAPIDLTAVFDDLNLPFGDYLTYTAQIGDDSLATVAVIDDELRITLAPDQFGSTTITVRATDSEGLFVEDTFNLQVLEVNDAPVVTNLLADHFLNMNHPGIQIHPANHFFDVDEAMGHDSLVFTSSTDNEDLVTLSHQNGKIHVNLVPDAYGLAEVTIRATDQDGEWVEDTFRLIVRRPNAAPEVTGPLGTLNLLEDFEPFAIDLTSVFEDPDAIAHDETLTFQLLANINNLTSAPSKVQAYIVGDQLWLAAPPNLFGESTLKIRARDSFGAYVDHTFMVEIESVNDAPIVVNAIPNQLVPVNGDPSSFNLNTVFYDVDIATNGDVLAFTVQGNTEPTLVAATIDNGQLTLTPQANQVGTSTLTIRATDLDGEFVDLIFEYTISSESQAPYITTALPDLNLLEDANPVLIDLDQHFDDLDILISNDELTFTVEIESPNILTGTVDGNQLTLTPEPDASGKSLVTVTATDTTGKSVSDSFYVDIEAVNDAPVVLVSPGALSYSEGVTQTVFDLSKIFFDADIAWGNDSLTYSVVSNDNTTLATPSFMGDYLVVDYTEEETGGVTLKIRATDIENEFAEFEVEITITEAEAGVTAIGAISEFGLVRDTSYGSLITSNASVVGRVNRIDESAELVIEFDHDNDGTPEGFRTIQAEEDSLINYDYVVYDPRYSDSAMENHIGPVTLHYRSGLVDETGAVTTYLPWDSFEFELVAPNASYTTSTISLAEDTGHSSTDKITTNPQLNGTVGKYNAFAEIELDWDGNGEVDSLAFADEEGEWSVTPLILAYGAVDVHHRVRHWDEESGSFVRGPWSTFTFTLEPEAAPAIATLHLQGEQPHEEEYPEGPPAEPSTTSAPVLVGSLVSPSTDEEPEAEILDEISQLEIQFDLTGNQQPDDSTFTDANGDFTYVPRGLSDGSNTIAARSVRIDWRTGEEIYGAWKQYTFVYEANPIPEVEQLRLLNDTGESSTDNISEDVTLIGRFSFTTNGPMFAEFDHTGNNEIDGLTEVYNDGTFVYLPPGLPAGVHTIRARASIWDANSGDFVEGDWTSITLEKVIPVNEPATITEFRLFNDNGIDPSDGITTDPALTGQVANSEGVAYLRVEFDHTGDGSVDGQVNSREDGSFLYVPLGLASGAHTIRARVQEWDYASRQFIHGDWQPFSFTIAQPVNDVATIETLVLASDTGSSSSDNITANALLTGTIDNVEGLAGLQIQFDHDNNGTVDGFAFSDERGEFFYNPGQLDYGTHTIRARVREWDHYTSTYLTGAWTSITFTYEDQPNSAAEFVAVGLENAEQVGSDWITHDGVFGGRIRNQGSLAGITIEIDRTGNGSADEYAQTDSRGQFRFTPLDLTDGQVTLHVRTREMDPLSGDSLLGSWQTFSFIYEELVNEPAAFQNITLPYNTSADPEHYATNNPTVSGVISNDGPVSGLQVQFDTLGDGVPNQFTTTDADGKFQHTLLGLVPGERTVFLRIKEYDAKQTAIYSDWTSFEFELEPMLALGGTSGVLALELLNGTGMATADNKLTGSLAGHLGSGNITIEFDHTGNGQVDGTISGTAGQNFTYLPEGLEPGYHHIKARVAGETTWQSLSFISSEDPESQETQDLINSLGNYGDAISKIDANLRESLNLSALNHSQASASIIDNYDFAISQASSTYYAAIGNANSTYEAVLASARASLHSAQAAAGANFQTDLANFTGDKTQFEFEGFALAQNPNFVAAKPPADSELPTPPQWNDTPDHFRFDPTKDPVYQAQVAAAQTARTNALRDAYKQYEAALETAAQEGNDAVKAIVADYHAGKRQAEFDRQSAIRTKIAETELAPAKAKQDLEKKTAQLNAKYQKERQLLDQYNVNYGYQYGLFYFYTTTGFYSYGGVGDLIPDSVYAASNHVNGHYDLELLPDYRSAYISQLAIYEGQIEAIQDAFDTIVDQLDWINDPEGSNDTYDAAFSAAEASKRSARIGFWTSMASADYPIELDAHEVIGKFKLEVLEKVLIYHTDLLELERDYQLALTAQRASHEAIKNEAEIEFQRTLSSLLLTSEIAIANARHSQAITTAEVTLSKNSSVGEANINSLAASAGARNEATQSYSLQDNSRGSEYLANLADRQFSAESELLSAETDYQDATIDSARTTQGVLIDNFQSLAHQEAERRHEQRLAMIDLFEKAVQEVDEANRNFQLDEVHLFYQQLIEFAKHEHYEGVVKVESFTQERYELAELRRDRLILGDIDPHATISEPYEYPVRPFLPVTLENYVQRDRQSALEHRIRWERGEIEVSIRKHESILKYETGATDGSGTGGYYGLLESWRHTTTDVWAEYDKAVLDLEIQGNQKSAALNSASEQQAETDLLTHQLSVASSAQTRDLSIIDSTQVYQNEVMAEEHSYRSDRAGETLSQFDAYNNHYGGGFAGMQLANFQSFSDNVIEGMGGLISAAAETLHGQVATFQSSQAAARASLAQEEAQALSDANKQSIGDENGHFHSAQSLYLTYAKAMIDNEATRDKAIATADATKSREQAAASRLLQVAHQKHQQDFREISLHYEYNFPLAEIDPGMTISEAMAARKEADLDAQVDYSNAMAAANEQHVTLTEDAKVAFAQNFQSAFDTYADDSLDNHHGLNSKVAANANSLTSKLATSSTTAANAMADAEQTYTTSAGTTEANLQNDLTPQLNDHQTNLVVNNNQYLVNIKSDHVTALTSQDDGSYFSSANIAQAVADAGLATETATYAETLSTDIGAAVTGMISSLSSVMTTQVGAMATTLGTLAKATAATASAQWIASASAGGDADKGVFNTEDSFEIATAKASVKAHVEIVKAEAEAKKAFAANNTTWTETMAPAKKTFELDKDADLTAAQAAYDDALEDANDTRETANRAAQQTQASEHGQAMVDYATDYKTALTARATGIGTAETAYTSATSQAASARTSQDGSSISAAVASAQAADSQALTGTQSAMSTFGTASSTAGTQYLANVKPKLVDFASASTAAHWDYQEGHAAERLTKAQAAATANPGTDTAITLAKAEGHQVYVDGLRGEAITFAKTMVGDLLTHQQDVQSAANTLAAGATTKINEFTQAAHAASSAHQLAQLQAANTHESNLVAAAGQLSIAQTTASASLGNQLSEDYGDYLVGVYTALKDYGKQLHHETKGTREAAEDDFNAALLTLDLTQISKTATADLAWAQSAATNLQSYNQASVTADAALMKNGATARYAFDTGMAASEKQLTIDLGQKFRTAELGFHNADTALMVDQATATGNFSLAQANKQLAGTEKLHLELDLPYTQFLVDRATADADYAAEARQLLIGHALNINDAANIRITADQLASSITESANAAAVQGHASTVASSLSSGTQAIAGSLGSSGSALASTIQSYQQAEAQIQATHRTATQQAERQFQHDDNPSAKDTAVAAANEARDAALKTLREAYVTQEITLDGAHRVKVASEQLAHTNNVGQSRVSTTTTLAGNLRDYLHAAADRDESFAHDMADLVVGLGENLAEERLAAHDAIFALDDTPWGIRHLAEEVAGEAFAKAVLPAEAVLAKDRATAETFVKNELVDAEYERVIEEIQAESAFYVAQDRASIAPLNNTSNTHLYLIPSLLGAATNHIDFAGSRLAFPELPKVNSDVSLTTSTHLISQYGVHGTIPNSQYLPSINAPIPVEPTALRISVEDVMVTVEPRTRSLQFGDVADLNAISSQPSDLNLLADARAMFGEKGRRNEWEHEHQKELIQAEAGLWENIDNNGNPFGWRSGRALGNQGLRGELRAGALIQAGYEAKAEILEEIAWELATFGVGRYASLAKEPVKFVVKTSSSWFGLSKSKSIVVEVAKIGTDGKTVRESVELSKDIVEWARRTLKNDGKSNSYEDAAQFLHKMFKDSGRVPGAIADQYCFDPMTPVLTPQGKRPISEIEPGDSVLAFDHDSNQWAETRVQRRSNSNYSGPLVQLKVNNSWIRVTANHPIWVLQGKCLNNRPRVESLAPNENEEGRIEGRWVNSQDLEAGDKLLGQCGTDYCLQEKIVENVTGYAVCNLTVEKFHNFAVGDLSILAHNAAWCDILGKHGGTSIPEGLKRFARENGFKSSQIHAHHIVQKTLPEKIWKTVKGFDKVDKNWSKSRQAAWYIGQSHKIMAKWEVSLLADPKLAEQAARNGEKLHNMTWAINGNGTHSLETIKAVYERISKAVDAKDLEEILKRIGEELSAGKKLF